METIGNNILTAANSSIPNKVFLMRPRDLPWYHNQIKHDIRKRNRLHKIAKQTNTPASWVGFRESRNKVTTEIRNSKINNFKKITNNLQHGNLTNTNWWKLTKQFLKEGNESDIPILIKNDEQFSSPVEKAEILNQHFSDQSKLDESQATLPLFENPPYFIDQILITQEDVNDVLINLDTNKACGLDLIHPKTVKEGGIYTY